eukprot:PLAT3681.9.p1 GENE.PLAT3681.9~~PLAT3681.9.p1  ORF type:complete len:344 (+),score=90.99 PLAT3681.9:41-1072(+)
MTATAQLLEAADRRWHDVAKGIAILRARCKAAAAGEQAAISRAEAAERRAEAAEAALETELERNALLARQMADEAHEAAQVVSDGEKKLDDLRSAVEESNRREAALRAQLAVEASSLAAMREVLEGSSAAMSSYGSAPAAAEATAGAGGEPDRPGARQSPERKLPPPPMERKVPEVELLITKGLSAASPKRREFDAATSYFKQAVALAEELGLPLARARALGNHAAVLYQQKQRVEAAELYEQARAVFIELRELTRAERVGQNLCACYESTGDYKRADEVYDQRLRAADKAELTRKIESDWEAAQVRRAKRRRRERRRAKRSARRARGTRRALAADEIIAEDD